MAIDMSQFYQVFFEEVAEHLTAMEALLLGLNVENPDSEQLNAIFRAAHSIKGSAGTFGFSDLAATTHLLETLLDRIRKRELRLRADMLDAFLEAGDLLRGMLKAHQDNGTVNSGFVETVSERLRQLSAVESSDLVRPSLPQPTIIPSAGKSKVGLQTAPVVKRVFDIQFVPTELSAKGHAISNLLDEFRSMGDLEVVAKPDVDTHNVGFWRCRLITDSAPERFSELIDFIADNGAWKVSEDIPVAVSGVPASGLAADSPGLPDEDCGYGFFAPADERSVGDIAAAMDVAEECDGYGFFAPWPAGTTVLRTLPVTPMAEDECAYGFFAPLVPPPAQLAVAAEDDKSSASFAYPTPVPPTDLGGAEACVQSATASREDLAIAPERNIRAAGPAVAAGDSIRVSIEKVDQLINLVGELVITQAMLLQATRQIEGCVPERLISGVTQLERNTRDLQESVMSIRMMPISFVFSRFPRVVRDLSAKLGKQVELKTFGEATELDKGLIERIADPLTHLIRNSLDHGIELPEQRVAAGKRPIGTITLNASHQGGNVVIEVGDDGAGLPRNKILAKARERGLPVSDRMTDAEVFDLIFEAGFSTADQVTDVSGRGVGMDVVRRNIQGMGGRVEIESMLGIGTRTTVRLPLTLAILDGMSVAVGDQTYILPLTCVIESLQPQVGDVKTLSNQARVIQVRGEYLPVIALHEVFNLKSRWTGFTQGIMVVIDADGAKAALYVDALVGQHQVVIKSLEANYRRVVGVSGATIMGDGQVALILDASSIVGMAKSNLRMAG